MTLDIADGLLRAVAPALLGVVVAVALVAQARREHVEPVPPEALARMFLFVALPLGGLLLAAAGAFLALGSPETVGLPLLALGAAAFLQGLVQGVLGARAVPRVLRDPAAVGPALLPLALAEAPTAAALVWVVLAASAGAPGG